MLFVGDYDGDNDGWEFKDAQLEMEVSKVI